MDQRAAQGYAMAVGAGASVVTIGALTIRALFPVLIARAYGLEALGIWVLAWSWTDGVSKVGVFGLDTAVTAEVAARSARGDASGARAAARLAIRLGFSVSLVVAAAVGATAWFMAGASPSGRPFWLALGVMAPALPAIAVARISAGISLGRLRMRNDLYARGIADTAAFLGVFAVGAVAGRGPITAAVATAAGAAAGAVMGWWLARAVLPTAQGPAHDVTMRHLLQRSLPIGGYGLLNLAVMRLDVLLLGALVGTSSAITAASFGIYCAAAEVAGSARKIRQAFDPIFTPMAAGQAAASRDSDLRASLARVARWTLTVAVPLVLVLTVSGGALLAAYGAAFRDGMPWLAVLAAALAANSVFGVVETAVMLKAPGLNLLTSATALAVQGAATLTFAPAWGPMGAAAAVLAGSLAQTGLRLVQLRRVFHWGWPWHEMTAPLAAGMPALLLALAVRSLGTTVWFEVGAAVVGVASFIVVLVRIGHAEDAAIVGQLRRRIGGAERRPV